MDPTGEAEAISARAAVGSTEAPSLPGLQKHPSAEQECPGAVQVGDNADAGDTGSEAGVQTPFGLGGGQRKDPLDDGDDQEVGLKGSCMQHTYNKALMGCLDSPKKCLCHLQVQEHEHRLKEVAWNLQQRVRQELAYPVVLHFYSWLLQGLCRPSMRPLHAMSRMNDQECHVATCLVCMQAMQPTAAL